MAMTMAAASRTRKPDEQSPFYKRRLAAGLEVAVPVPTHFRCPISLDLMRDPVTGSTGITYDRPSIETWLDVGNSTCPVTNQSLTAGEELIPNHSIRRMIQDWCVAYGIDRVPTPTIPLTAIQASELLSEIVSMSRRGHGARCVELVAKVKSLGKESERSRRCIVAAGATIALAASFDSLARNSSESSVMGGILSALVGFLPLDDKACRYLGSPESLASLASIAKCADFSGRLNAVLVIKELLASGKTLAHTEELIEALVKLIKEPISSHSTKASLLATFYLASSDEGAASRFAERGIVPRLIDIVVDSDKSVSEKALAAFDGVCSSRKGREEARAHALAVPVLVKKMFRVSEMATEFAVSALWKLGKEGGEGCLVEALQVGAFQKLLLLLQVGCSGGTKEKASELLKMLNEFKGRLDCIDKSDLRGLKRLSH